MKVLVAGSTGAIGRPLVRQLLAAGHDVVALTRSPSSAAELERQGAHPRICDVFDATELRRVAVDSAPEVVVHQLTALPRRIDPRRVKSQLAATNRLRTEGTHNLLEASRASGARRFIAQSVAFAYRPDGERLKTETDDLYDDAPRSFAEIVGAIRALESMTLDDSSVEGVVLRYGFFYGPGTAYAPGESFAEDVRRRRVPLLGAGQGVFSFIHVEDAAAVVLAALTGGAPGVYNVVDDEPARVADWLPLYAKALGASPPRHLPQWLGRWLAGPYATYLMCEQRGVSNAKAKAELDLVISQQALWRGSD